MVCAFGLIHIITTFQVKHIRAIINLTCLRFCNAVDGTTDFMTVWREFAEPSPTDRSTIEKGTGAKLTNILTHLISCYNEDADFRTFVDAYKCSLA